MLRSILRDAVAQLDLPRDPTLGVRFPRDLSARIPEEEKARTSGLTLDELRAVLEWLRTRQPWHHTAVVLLAFTGQRWCHVSGLRWEDIDYEEKAIRFRRKFSAYSKSRVGEITRGKRAPDELPLHPLVEEILKDHHRRQLADGGASEWLFPDHLDRPAPSQRTRRWYLAACKACGVDRYVKLHGLRRTFTDLLRLAHVDQITRLAMVGHRAESMQAHYSCVSEQEGRAAQAQVHVLFGDLAAPPPIPSRGVGSRAHIPDAVLDELQRRILAGESGRQAVKELGVSTYALKLLRALGRDSQK